MVHVASQVEREAEVVGWQQTLAEPVRVSGKGLLLGQDASVVIEPAEVDHGIVFERSDLDPPVRIPADARYVSKQARRTTLRNGEATVETVEHCMSALAGLHIDNALIRINGPELPCGDGSAALFVDPILAAGLLRQDAPRRVYRIRRPIMLEDGDSMISIFPSERAEFAVTFDLDYGDNTHRIKRQMQSFVNHNGDYSEQIARARTFSLQEEAQALWDRGMCRHLTPSEVLVIGEDGPIDNEYRFENEPVRHKILDLLGDLYLVGRPVHGRVVARKSGHDLNRRMALRIIEQIRAEKREEAIRHGCELDIRAIQRIMPHRYPMLLVDRVVSVDGDQRAIGVKNVTINEPFFNGHYPGTPIMPGVLIVEAMAQLGGLLMSRKLEHTGKIAVLLSLDKVKLRKPVTPGDQVVLEVEALRGTTRTGSVQARALVADRVAAEARIRFMLVDPDQR